MAVKGSGYVFRNNKGINTRADGFILMAKAAPNSGARPLPSPWRWQILCFVLSESKDRPTLGLRARAWGCVRWCSGGGQLACGAQLCQPAPLALLSMLPLTAAAGPTRPFSAGSNNVFYGNQCSMPGSHKDDFCVNVKSGKSNTIGCSNVVKGGSAKVSSTGKCSSK